MHIGKVTTSTAGWQSLKERTMQGLTIFQEYVTGVFAFLNNFVCIDRTACDSYEHCRGYFCHEGIQSFQTSLDERANNTSVKYLEDYSDEELIALLNYTLYRPCNASEQFDRACLYDSSCIAYLLPDNVIELVCNCTPGWKGEQCELADMDDSEMAVHMGGFQANFLILMFVYLLVDFVIGFYFSHQPSRKNHQDLKKEERNSMDGRPTPSGRHLEFIRRELAKRCKVVRRSFGENLSRLGWLLQIAFQKTLSSLM